jgi:Lon protease-like protein
VSAADIPLFPLSSVLFPGGQLRLRIFEPRYLDLVRDCARAGSGFGVCLILEGAEVGEPAVPAAFGTLAHISDFHTLSGGLLGIHAQGSERFRVEGTRVRSNGLVHGTVRFLPADPLVAVPIECALLATILERLLERIGGERANVERTRYDDASWVGFRLAETLPLTGAERQELLQMTDPVERLHRLMHHLPRFQHA